MSGGKGGSSKSQTTIPTWIQEPAIRNIARAEDVARMGYQPYYGPEVAAFNPMQTAAMQSAADAAYAFGIGPQMNVSSSIPQPTEYAGGIQGYGSGDIFEQSVDQFQQRQPDQAALYSKQFVGPDVQSPYSNAAVGYPVMGGKGGGESSPAVDYGQTGNIQGNISDMVSYANGQPSPFIGGDYANTGIPIDYSTMQPMSPAINGPYVAAGMGTQNPVPSMVGGGSSGSSGAPSSEAIPDWINPNLTAMDYSGYSAPNTDLSGYSPMPIDAGYAPSMPASGYSLPVSPVGKNQAVNFQSQPYMASSRGLFGMMGV